MSWPGGDVSTGVDGGVFSEDPNEILVFGYGAKLFRDDEKASWIDREEHLIPWMGDPELKVDRYDGRGALMDLRPFVAKAGGYSEKMDEEERELEKVLDHERYSDLREDEDFNDMEYQEVEFRKFQSDVNGVVGGSHQSQNYAAISYNYEEKAACKSPEKDKGSGTKDELPYTAPVGLSVPADVVLPTTMKLHAIIEKTAKFIASHGNQMEIILKTKQSGNPLFNFLEYRDNLNPYYKFLVQAIRSNAYKPSDDPVEVQFDSPAAARNDGDCTDDSEGDDSGYLHPSLFKTNSNSDSKANSIKYKPPTGPTAYSLLVSKIKEVSGNSEPPPVPPSVTVQPQHSTPEDESFYYHDMQHSPNSQFGYHMAGYQQYNPGFHVGTNQPESSSLSRPKNQVPSEQEQQVIEKMASYVVKNGPAFEELAKTRGDPRFIFLNPSHEFHWYYLNCKERFKAETTSVVAQGNFVKYGDPIVTSSGNSSASQSRFSETLSGTPSGKKTPATSVSKVTSLPSISLPLSASGIPIANHASFSNRPATIPPEVASRIEEIRKKKDLLKKEQANSSTSQDGVKKDPKTKIQFSSSIGKSMPLAAGDLLLRSSQEVQTDSLINEATTTSADNTLLASANISSRSSHNKNVENVEAKTENTDLSVSDDARRQEMEKELLKNERKRKAALFLMKLQNKTLASAAVDSLDNNGVASNDPGNKEMDTKENGSNSEVDMNPDVPIGEASSVKLCSQPGNGSYSSEITRQLRRESSASSVECLMTRHDRSSSEKSSHHRSRSRSVSRRPNYIRRSRSSSSNSLHSRKRSKSKHSKKRKKKREKAKRSRSSSKKSKRRKYDR